MSRKDLRAYLGLAAVLLASTVAIANAETLPLKKLTVDGSQQLVVEFGGAGAFPAAPHVLDLPGPNHRVVLDFTGSSIDKDSLPTAEELSNAVRKDLPFVKSVRYSELANGPSPTARLVFDLPEDMKVKPRVVKMEQGTVIVSFGSELTAAAPATTPAETVVASNPADTAPSSVAVDASGAAADAGSATLAAASEIVPTPISDAAPAEATPTPSPDATAAELKPAITETPVTGLDGTAPAATTTATPEPTPTAADATTSVDNAPGPEGMGTPSTSTPAPTATPSSSDASPVTGETDKKISSVKRYNAAVQFHLQGKLAEAIAEYKSALEANPALSEAHSNLGLIFNQQHNYAQALAEFRKALAANPKDAITYNGIGAALRAERDLQGAIKNWQTAVSLDPKLATAHYNLGTAYEIEKEYDKALSSYNQAVKNDYRLGEAYYRMGLIMERKRRPDDAAEQFKEALKVSGDSEYSEDARQRLAFLTQGKKGATKTK